jgi:2-methylcitrate dehydratase PrpD
MSAQSSHAAQASLAVESPANSAIAAAYITTLRKESIAAASLDAAKMCLVDWVGVCLGARLTPEAKIISGYVSQTAQPGPAPMLIGGNTQAPAAALVNGMLSHCLDYDDTHIPTALHASGPTWAAVLALGAERQSSETDLLKAFVCGFEVGASLGSGGVGVKLNESGWHSTAVLGRVAAASASAYLLRLSADSIEDALGLAATQAGGLTASFGTMAKPFHAGKAAMDGMLSAQLAGAGLNASRTMLDSPKGLFGTIFQDRKTIPSLAQLGKYPEIMQNSLKPYAACQLAHAPIDAAQLLRERLGNASVESIVIDVNPLAVEIAGVQNPKTPTAARFSTAFCVALTMKGYPVAPNDFTTERLSDPELIELASRVSLRGDAAVSRTSAHLKAVLSDGTSVQTDVEHAFGSAGNPMAWPQLETKFLSLVEPVFGEKTTEVFEVLTNFEKRGSFARYMSFMRDLERVSLNA